ncbi:hypothetical protein MJO48_02780 [Dickeya fangzhongdai]|uniref:hypothetical protein n=1 Tax=Dickeya fangzhongdai TaxID=1778540 RepID=UPI001EFB81E5|nr:hypothetical protein [Dickeya fangzhongdai]ULR31655.1 hypothetical protein MJO48_02780 [Dickeya fangzhongdai]
MNNVEPSALSDARLHGHIASARGYKLENRVLFQQRPWAFYYIGTYYADDEITISTRESCERWYFSDYQPFNRGALGAAENALRNGAWTQSYDGTVV